MLQATLLSIAALAPQQSWSALPLPRLCEESFGGAQMPRLRAGQHIRLASAPSERARGTRARLTPADLGSLLQASARAAERNLRISPYSPPLYVQGSAQDLAWARRTLEAIDRAAAREELQVTVWLVPGGSGAAAPPEGTLPEGALHWQKRMSAGSSVSFGPRERLKFVANYDVEVASHSGVAAPIIGEVTLGNTLFLSISRVDSGRRYHLRAHLDLAELTELSSFDPRTPDLGLFSQPRVTSVGLSFSATGAMGSFQTVEIEGGPGSAPNWKLWIRVEGQAEPERPRASDAQLEEEWGALDVSLLEARPPPFAALLPGTGLSAAAQLDGVVPASAPISASGVLAATRVAGRGSRRGPARSLDGGREPMQICEGLILVALSAADEPLFDALQHFVDAAQAPRLVSTQIELESGDLRVRFPSAFGELARLWVGSERTLVTGYSTEIAPNTWMPSPRVEIVRDGLAWQGRLGTRFLQTEAFASRTRAIEVQSREDAQLGALQLPKRSIQSSQRGVLPDGTRQELWPSSADGRALSLRAALPR